YEPDNGNNASDEIWDSSVSGSYWEEIGIISGKDPNGNYDTRKWFWADNRPNGGGYHFHLWTPSPAKTGTSYGALIAYDTPKKTWALAGGDRYAQIGTSTGQTAQLTSGTAGTLYSGGRHSGIRDAGNIRNLKWEFANGSWHNWGTAADGGAVNGPGNYIAASY